MKQKTALFTFLWLCLTAILNAQIYNDFPRLHVSASGGLGFLSASGNSGMDNIVDKSVIDKATKDLRRATNLNGDVHYLFNGGWGLGVKYLFQKTSTNNPDVVMDVNDGLHYVITDIWEKDYVNFIGPSFFGITSLGRNNNLYFTSSLSAGYMWLRSEASVLFKNVLATSNNIGFNAELGLDYLFTPTLGLGINLGYLTSYFDKVKMTDGITTQEQNLTKEKRYNASNFHLSVGLRYYLNK